MAGLLCVVVGEAEALKVIVDGASEVVGDSLGYVFGYESLEIGEYGPGEGESDNTSPEKDQKAECVFFEDLVYGVAEESGDGEGEEGGDDEGEVGQGKVFLVRPEEGREAEEGSHSR